MGRVKRRRPPWLWLVLAASGLSSWWWLPPLQQLLDSYWSLSWEERDQRASVTSLVISTVIGVVGVVLSTASIWQNRRPAVTPDADAPSARAAATAPGRLIRKVTPAELEVWRVLPAGPTDRGALTDYVPRAHDHALRDLVTAAFNAPHRSGIAVLVGGSASGKTRALFEALHTPVPSPGRRRRWLRWQRQPRTLAWAGWRVWPAGHTLPAGEFRDRLDAVEPRTVVWLNEAQRYLIDPEPDTAAAIAARLHALLADPDRAPVLILGTLWPDYLDTVTAQTAPGQPDWYADARALLAGHTIEMPDAFTGADLAAARASTDTRLSEAITAADTAAGGPGQATWVSLTQHVAGTPELLDLYTHGPRPARAVLEAAMDARRLGHGEQLPLALLHHAAPDYLTRHEQRQYLTDPDWFTTALTTLTTPRRAAAARALHPPPVLPDRPAGDDTVRLDDYLDQHGRLRRAERTPPGGFWASAAAHAHPDHLLQLGTEAWYRGLYRAAAQLHKNATIHGDPDAAWQLINLLRTLHPADHQPTRWAVTQVALDDPGGVSRLLETLHRFGPEDQTAVLVARDPAANVALDDIHGVEGLLRALHETEATGQVFALAQRTLTHISLDDLHVVASLLGTLHKVGATEQATVLAQWATEHVLRGHLTDAGALLHSLHLTGAVEQVAALARYISNAHIAVDDPYAIGELLQALHDVGATEQAATLATRITPAHVDFDDPSGIALLLDALYSVVSDGQGAVFAERAADPAPLDGDGLRSLIDAMERVPGAQQLAVLTERAATHTCLDEDYDGVDELLKILHKREATGQLDALARRVAEHARLDHPRSTVELLHALHEVEATPQVVTLARRAAEEIELNDPFDVAMLLQALHHIKATGQIDTLIARSPATHVALKSPYGVNMLLSALHELEATDQISTLMARTPAAHVVLGDNSHPKGLLSTLRRIGADRQASILTERLAAGKWFHEIVDLPDYQARFRFGREPDGTAAAPWTWGDLE